MSHLLESILRKEELNFDFVLAKAVQEGLELMQQEKPSLVLFDLDLLDGECVPLSQLRETWKAKHIPVIGLRDAYHIRLGGQPPALSYLLKCGERFECAAYVSTEIGLFIPEELVSTVCQVLGISVEQHVLDTLIPPPKKPRRVSERRILATAQRLVRKYGQPNPRRARPSVTFSDAVALANVWEWATSVDQTDVLSALAHIAHPWLQPEERRMMRQKVREYAEQAEEQGDWDEYAGFLIALAELEEYHNFADRLALYEKALDVYARLDHWAGEATCAYEAAGIYRYFRKFDEARRLSLRSYVLWARAKHRKGIAASLGNLSDLLEIDGRYIEACRLLYCEKKLDSHSMWKISTRDCLRRISYDHKISPDQYESRKPAEKLAQDLILEIFGVNL